jgi:altronate hydrolase
VECAHHVSRLIVQKSGSDEVHLIGFPGCYPNQYSLEMMQRLCTHPNVGAVLLVSLGCEGFQSRASAQDHRRKWSTRRFAGDPGNPAAPRAR